MVYCHDSIVTERLLLVISTCLENISLHMFGLATETPASYVRLRLTYSFEIVHYRVYKHSLRAVTITVVRKTRVATLLAFEYSCCH